MKSAGKARNNGLYRHIRTSKEIIRNLLNDLLKNKMNQFRVTACVWTVAGLGGMQKCVPLFFCLLIFFKTGFSGYSAFQY